MKKSTSGFTIVELVVAIAVIAILAAVTIVSYNNAQMRARAATTLADLTTTEDAFRLYFIRKGFETWPQEGVEVPFNASIRDYIDTMSGFSTYMSKPPRSDDGDWQYDNDYDTKGFPCSDEDDINDGVNIAIKINDYKLSEAIDASIDKGDGRLCGKFRWFISGSKAGDTYYNIHPNGREGTL